MIELNLSTHYIYFKKGSYKNNIVNCKSYISDLIFNCQVYSNYLLCFYLIGDSDEIEISVFQIENSFSLIEDFDNRYTNIYINKIMQIKSSLVFETNNIMICYYWEYKSCFWNCQYSVYSNCLFYDILKKDFNEIFINLKNYQVLNIYHFNETKSLIFLFNDNTHNIIYLYEINENIEKDGDLYQQKFNECTKIKSLSLDYNYSTKEYSLICDCYKEKENTNKWNIIHNISIFFSKTNIESPSSNFLFEDKELSLPEIIEEEKDDGLFDYFFEEEDIDIEDELKENELKVKEDKLENYKQKKEEEVEKEIEKEEEKEEEVEKKEEEKEVEKEEEKVEKEKKEEEKKEEKEKEEKEEEEKDVEKESSIITEKENENEKIAIKLDISADEIERNISNIINDIEIGLKYEFIGQDFKLIINPINSSLHQYESHVNFTQCEIILRNILNISSSKILTFLQMEIDKKDEKSLINTIEYQVYDNKTVLDLSLCNNSKIQVFHSIKDSSLININSISSFKDSGIDIFNIKDSFFNDICQPYSDSKNDIILEDRIKDIYMNYSLCEEGCNYNEINTHYMTISCDCHIKTHLTTNQTSVKLTQFDDIKIESNFGIIKCFNLVFSFQGKLKNIGFWIFLFLVLIKISLLILYFSKGIKPIKEYLIKEMVKYGYIKRYDRNKILKKKENKNDGIIKKGISKNINNRKKIVLQKRKIK